MSLPDRRQYGHIRWHGSIPIGSSFFVILLALFLVVSITSTTYIAVRMRNEAIANSVRFAELSARSYESNFSQSMVLLDVTLSSLVMRLKEARVLDAAPTRLSAYLSNTLYFTPQLKSLSLVDDTGRVVASSSVFELDAVLPLAELRGQEMGDLTHVGWPWAGADFSTGRPITPKHPLPEGSPTLVPVSRTIKEGSKEFLLLATMDISFFAGPHMRNLTGPAGQLTVLRSDGIVLMTTGKDKSLVGQQVPHEQLMAAVKQAHPASFDALAILKTDSIVALEPSLAYPMTMMATLDRDAVLEVPRREIRRFVGLGATATLLIALLAIALYLREQRRLREQHAAERAERQRQRALLDALPAAIVMISPQGTVDLPNAGWRKLVHAHTEGGDDGVGQSYFSLWRRHLGDAAHEPEVARQIEAVLAGEATVAEFEFPYKNDGEARWFAVSVHSTNATGLPGAVAMHYDITTRKEAEAQSRLAKQVIDNSAEGIVITDLDTRIVSINPAALRISGYTADEVLGQTTRLFSSHTHGPEFIRELWDSIGRSGVWAGEICNRRKDGSLFSEWLTISKVYDDQGRHTNYAGIFTDISDRKAAEERIRYLSEHDALTSLPNRIQFQEQLAQSIARAKRTGAHFALLFIDLDRFKVINDTLGHVVGDRLLQAVATRIRECLRTVDGLCRQGGDEFLVMLDGIEFPEDAARVAEKLIEHVGKVFDVDNHELRVTPSIGIALYPADGSDPTALIKSADMAMYRSKDRGRNTYHFHTQEMDAQTEELLSLERGLRHALDRGELSLHYQPLVDIASGRIIGAEALMRWSSPEKGAISPARFIPVAESSGQIVAMGRWALREACTQAQRWRQAGFPDFRIAVNVSVIQLEQTSFLTDLQQALADSGYPAHLLELEVTESLLVNFTDHGLDLFAQLRQMDIALSIDDFGTGYSSLAYLRQLAVDKLKIDKSFVNDIADDLDAASIIKAIISMARSLNLQVLAEGVETEAQLAFLRENGCDQIQGYLFSRPLAAEAFEALLASGGGKARPT